MRSSQENARTPHRDTAAPMQRPLLVVAFRGGTEPPRAAGLLDEAEARGWRLLDLRLTGGSLTGETIAGAMVSWLPTDPIVRHLQETGRPIVRLGRLPHPGDGRVPAVLPDIRAAGRMAADHLVERGFATLVLVSYPGMLVAEPAWVGFREQAEATGCAAHHRQVTDIALNPLHPQAANRSDRQAEELVRWLADLPRPVGLFCMSPILAASVCVICQRAGLLVPEDIALLAWGDKASCGMAPVPVSAIDTDPSKMVRVAAELLSERIKGQTVPEQTYVAPRGVVTRRSSHILAVDDPTVARAIRFIWDHLAQDISVDDVAEATRTPRYKLERLFRKHLKRGINEELQRVRLERFCKLLRTTKQPVRELAPQVGYSSGRYLHHAFRKHYGMTPREYRFAGRK